MRILGVDHGSQRVGVALSDEDGRLASPLTTVDRKKGGDVAEQIAALAVQHGVRTVVVGLPLELDGREGGAARRARALGDGLRGRGLEVVFRDERLTTVEAERKLRMAGASHATRRDAIDQAAACAILQGHLDEHGGAWGATDQAAAEDEAAIAKTEAELLGPSRPRGRR